MITGIPPFAQVNSGQHAALTGHARVDLVIGQDHGIDLDGVDVVAVITKDTRHFDFTDLAQLLNGEAAWPTTVLVPETITGSKVGKLLADNAGKSGTDHGAGQRSLSHTSGPQVDIVGGLVVLFVAFDGLVVHDAVEFVEVADAFEAAEFSPFVVGRYTMFTTSLNIQGG